MRRALCVLLLLAVSGSEELYAQNPISWRVTPGTTYYSPEQEFIVDICVSGVWRDSTAYRRVAHRSYPLDLNDGLAPDCPGSGRVYFATTTLAEGTNWLVFSFVDWGYTEWRDSVNVIYADTVTKTPAVTAPAANGIRLTPGQAHPLRFGVRNVGYTTATFTGRWACTGDIAACSPSSGTSFSIGPLTVGQSATVQIMVTPNSTPGSGTVRLIAEGTTSDTGDVAVTVWRDALAPITVTRMRDSLTRPNASASVAYFRVANRDAYATRSVSLSEFCSGMSGCTVTPSTVSIAPQSDTTVRVNFTMGINNAFVHLTATPSDGGAAGKDSMLFVPGTPPSVGVTLEAYEPRPRSSVARGQCLSIAAGPSAGVECGSLRLAYAFPVIRSMNKERALRLLYLGDHANPQLTVPVRVRITNHTDSVSLKTTFTVAGTHVVDTVAWHRACATADGCIINVTRSAAALTTGDWAYRVIVALVSDATKVDTITGTAIVVNRESSVFGAGWALEGIERLQVANDSAVNRLWIGGDGSARLYVPVGGNIYLPRDPVDRPDTLQRVINGTDTTWVRRLRNGARVTFDNLLRHVSTTNREGHVTRIRYSNDSSTRIDRILLPSPAVLDSFAYFFVYDSTLGTARIARVFSPWGGGFSRYTSITTDSARRILAIKEPIGDSLRFTYSGSSRLVASRIDRMGSATHWEYSAVGTVTRILPLNADSMATRICAVEGRTLATCAVDGSAEAALPPSRFLTVIDGPLQANPLDDLTRFFVGRFGAVDTVVNVYGATTRLTRADTLFPALVTMMSDPAGVFTHTHYTNRGLPDTVQVLNAWGPGSADTTRFTWDSKWDMVTEQRDPTGVISRFGIDATTGNRLWQQMGTHDSTRMHVGYDTLNRPLRVFAVVSGDTIVKGRYTYKAVSGNLDTVITAAGQRTQFTVNAAGVVSEVRSTLSDTLCGTGACLVQKLVHDSAGRVVADSTFAPARTWSINSGTATITDTAPARIAVVATNYDKESRPTLVSRISVGVGSGTNMVSGFAYDALGRTTSESTDGSSSDTVRFDRGGRPYRIKTRAGHEVLQAFDLLGQMLSRITPEVRYAQQFCTDCHDGVVSFDSVRVPFFRTPLTAAFSSVDVVFPMETAVFAYDLSGNMVQADNPLARVRRGYYWNGALKVDTTDLRTYASTPDNPVFGSTHRTALSYTYDAAGRPLSRSDNWGDRQTYGYDILGQLAWTRDSLSATQAAGVNFNYDRFGRLSVLGATGTATVESFVYDDADRVIRRGGAMPDTTTYDVRGKRTRVGGPLYYLGASRAMTAAYDALGHVVGMGTMGGAVTTADQYQVDAFGNQLRHQRNKGQVASGVAEDANAFVFGQGRLQSSSGIPYPDDTSRHAPNGGPPVQGYDDLTMTYDGAGNEITQRSVHHKWRVAPINEWMVDTVGHTYRWTFHDANDRPRQVEQNRRIWSSPGFLGQTTEMWYDALGRRVLMRFRADSTSCQTGGTHAVCMEAITRFSWDGDQLLREAKAPGGYTVSGASLDAMPTFNQWFGTRRYTQTGAIDKPLLLWVNDTAGRALVRNWRGTSAGGLLVSDGSSDGKVYPAATVDVFLAPDAQLTEAAPDAWLGSLIEDQLDPTGLLYRRNRSYDPQTGRFTQEDPIGLAGGMNLYGYAAGDPVNYADPFGLCLFGIKWCPPRDWHYSRNALNGPAPSLDEVEAEGSGWVEAGDFSSAWHRQGAGNGGHRKFTHPDGREFVYDASGQVVTDATNMGTFNFGTSRDGFLRGILYHAVLDVAPYLVFGNAPEDPTSAPGRASVGVQNTWAEVEKWIGLAQLAGATIIR